MNQQFAKTLSLAVLLSGLTFSAAADPNSIGFPLRAAGRGAPFVTFRDAVAATPNPSRGVRIVALADGDFDEDGIADLVAIGEESGKGVISFLAGNADYSIPNLPAARERRRLDANLSLPFRAPSNRRTPFIPDFVVAGDFDLDGHFDAICGRRGGSELLVLGGDGRGGFADPTTLVLSGELVDLAAGEVNRPDGVSDLVALVRSVRGVRLEVFEAGDGALRATPEEIPMPFDGKFLALGLLDSDRWVDVAIVGSAELAVVRGRDRRIGHSESVRLAVPAATVEQLQLGFDGVVAVAFGSFGGRNDRGQIALGSADGVVRFLEIGEPGAPLVREARSVAVGAAGRLVVAEVSAASNGDDLLVLSEEERAVFVMETASAGRDRPIRFDLDSSPAAVVARPSPLGRLRDLIVASGSQLLAVPFQPLATFTVTNANDSGAGSLRQAILDSNAASGTRNIGFSIGSGLQTITLLSQLPVILGGGVTVDATTQPGWAGTPLIELVGTSAGASAYGLILNSAAGSGNLVRGLSIGGFGGDAIRAMSTVMTSGQVDVEGCYLGLAADGTTLRANGGSGVSGIGFSTIGGTTAAQRNVISGNGFSGVAANFDSPGNFVYGNYIGTNAAGTAAVPNKRGTLYVSTVGGTSAGQGNLVSGNTDTGIQYSLRVARNLVGTNAAGTAAIGNGYGIVADSSALFIGSPVAGRNVVSGNNNGIIVSGGATTVVVSGNLVGTDITGSFAIPQGNGIQADGNVLIGGTSTAGGNFNVAGNLVSGNSNWGIVISGTGGEILGNRIGLDLKETTKIPNGTGIQVIGSEITIGGSSVPERNDISGNNFGIVVAESAAAVRILGNAIGTDATRVQDFGNSGVGIHIEGRGTIVGGSPDVSNAIQFNGGAGIAVATSLLGTNAFGSRLSCNSISGNGGLGIDLGPLGMTPNDPGDTDTGPNDLQNFPVISSVTSGAGTAVTGTLRSLPSRSYTVELFGNAACDASGYGEATNYLGSIQIATDSSGFASFTANLAANVPPGSSVTATATDPFGNTSEISRCRSVAGPFLVYTGSTVTGGNGNGALDPSECDFLSVTVRNDGIAAVTGASARLVTSGANLSITQPASSFPTIAAGGSATTSIPFSVSTGAGLSCQEAADFTLGVEANEGNFLLPFSLLPGGRADAIVSALGPAAIPDNTPTGASLDVFVPALFPEILTKVTVALVLTHTFDSDLVVSLVSPDGLSVILANRRGGGGDGYGAACPAGTGDTIFDDDALVPINSGVAPFLGSFQPDEPLSAFTGRPGNLVAGTWQIRVSDLAPVDTGQIECATITFTHAVCTAGTGGCSGLAGEATPLLWTAGTKNQLEWGAATGATGYNLYAGDPADLPHLLDPLGDSCRRWSTTSLTTGPVVGELPVGSFLWYLVRATGEVGEGPAGTSSVGPEQQEAFGSCP